MNLNVAYLLFAIEIDDVTWLRKLISQGVDLDVRLKHGSTFLHIAAKYGKTEMVKILLENFAEVNVKAIDGISPLSLASWHGHADVVKLLLAAGADFNSYDVEARRPVDIASALGYVEIAKLFFEHEDFKRAETNSLLHVVACSDCGSVEIAEMLIEKGVVDLNRRDRDGFKAIHLATLKGHTRLVKLLLSNGANINDRVDDLATLLHLAVVGGNVEMLKLLIISKCDVNACDKNNVTPLHLAVLQNACHIVVYLLQNGAFFDVDCELFSLYEQDCSLFWLLYRLHKLLFGSVQLNQPSQVEKLIRAGAIVDVVSGNYSHVDKKQGRTPLYYAVHLGFDNIVNILIKNEANITRIFDKGNTLLHIALSKKYELIVKMLLEKCPQDQLVTFVNLKTDKTGTSALHIAARSNLLSSVRLLLRHRAFFNVVDKNGSKPIDVTQNKDILKLLKTIGEVFDAVEKGDFTFIKKFKGPKWISDILSNVRNNKNKTLLQVAALAIFPVKFSIY